MSSFSEQRPKGLFCRHQTFSSITVFMFVFAAPTTIPAPPSQCCLVYLSSAVPASNHKLAFLVAKGVGWRGFPSSFPVYRRSRHYRRVGGMFSQYPPLPCPPLTSRHPRERGKSSRPPKPLMSTYMLPQSVCLRAEVRSL